MDDDPYGFCHGLEKDAAKVFNKAGLAAFEKQVRARFHAAATLSAAPGDSFRRNPDYQRRRCGDMLRTVYFAQKNVDAFVTLSEATGLASKDCHALATMLVARRKPAEALAWVERGLALDKKDPHGSMAGRDLAHLKRDLLTKLGRGNEALDAAWAEFRAHPSKYSYEDLMKYVPKAERRAWHEKAIEAAKGADLHSLIELLLETKETERLAAVVGQSKDAAIEDVSHYATEPAAKKLEKTHPEVAARLWCAQGMRVVNAKKSKYYDAALSTIGSMSGSRSRPWFLRAPPSMCGARLAFFTTIDSGEECRLVAAPPRRPTTRVQARAGHRGSRETAGPRRGTARLHTFGTALASPTGRMSWPVGFCALSQPDDALALAGSSSSGSAIATTWLLSQDAR